MLQSHIDIDEVSEFINNCSDKTGIYIGCDSERFRIDGTWYVDYVLVVVVHFDSKHGCKIFGAAQRERDYVGNADKPKMRLVTEAYKAAELYLALSKLVAHDIAIHLDLNASSDYGSNVAVQEAMGYVKGMCGIVPEIKPHSFAATYAADQFKSFGSRKVA